MPIFANVNGEIKELRRIFFNDNGVIREVESFHTQNDNNEIKKLFVRHSDILGDLEWVVYGDGDASTINSVTNNGYTINGTFTNKKRSVATKDRKKLLVGTQIKVDVSNIKYNTSEAFTTHVDVFLFDTQSKIEPYQSSESVGSSNTITVRNTGNYYIALSIYGRNASGNIHYCTADVNITVHPPRDLEWVTYYGDELDGSIINSVTNNGYTISGTFTNKKRSVSTKDTLYLPTDTWIKVSVSNIKYNTSNEVTTNTNIFLFKTDSLSNDWQSSESVGSSNTITVRNTGNYYIALSIFGRDASDNIHYCTADVDVRIVLPEN